LASTVTIASILQHSLLQHSLVVIFNSLRKDLLEYLYFSDK
jgi:hypothetical protein